MFKKVTWISVSCFFCFAALWAFLFCFVRESDIKSYQEALASSSATSSKNVSSTVHQVRQKVQKDIWVSDQGKRLHHRIESKSSILSLLPKKNKIEVIENLKGIRTTMQEKLYVENGIPMQQIRYFEADVGTYSYSLQQLVAKSVNLSLFRIPKQVLPPLLDPKQAFLRGVADDVLFSLAGNDPHFQAQRFKATFSKI